MSPGTPTDRARPASSAQVALRGKSAGAAQAQGAMTTRRPVTSYPKLLLAVGLVVLAFALPMEMHVIIAANQGSEAAWLNDVNTLVGFAISACFASAAVLFVAAHRAVVDDKAPAPEHGGSGEVSPADERGELPQDTEGAGTPPEDGDEVPWDDDRCRPNAAADGPGELRPGLAFASG